MKCTEIWAACMPTRPSASASYTNLTFVLWLAAFRNEDLHLLALTDLETAKAKDAVLHKGVGITVFEEVSRQYCFPILVHRPMRSVNKVSMTNNSYIWPELLTSVRSYVPVVESKMVETRVGDERSWLPSSPNSLLKLVGWDVLDEEFRELEDKSTLPESDRWSQRGDRIVGICCMVDQGGESPTQLEEWGEGA